MRFDLICAECCRLNLSHGLIFWLRISLWNRFLLHEVSIVRTVSKYVLLASRNSNARLILFVNIRFAGLGLRYDWWLSGRTDLVGLVLEDLSILELKVAALTCILIETFICYFEWSRWSSFHNCRIIWFSWQQGIITIVLSFISINLALLI